MYKYHCNSCRSEEFLAESSVWDMCPMCLSHDFYAERIKGTILSEIPIEDLQAEIVRRKEDWEAENVSITMTRAAWREFSRSLDDGMAYEELCERAGLLK